MYALVFVPTVGYFLFAAARALCSTAQTLAVFSPVTNIIPLAGQCADALEDFVFLSAAICSCFPLLIFYYRRVNN